MTAPASTGTARAVRTDIQGLRAIAVSLVLVYHLSPKSLTGGFTGVDVFFVISGFLITLHLLEHIPEHPRDLAQFWSRRIRRLLPASLLVLATTLVASRLFAPETQWANTARQVRAAALYFVNWLLSSDAVDYLAADNAPSPVQHFWSLSVEEQFYFVWPVLILLLAAIARLLGRKPLPFVLGGLVVVVTASLAYSVHVTHTNPQAAYFVTPARVWELGVGALLATLKLLKPGRLRHEFATPLALLGLGAIAYTAATYTGATPFPGWQAALPVLGTAAVIAAQPEHGTGSPGPILALRPIQYLGDISYSVYLWHWPLVVIVPQVTGHALTWTDRGSIVLATLGLATLTKALVEDRFRGRQWGIPLRKPFVIAVLAMALVVSGSVAQLAEVQHRREAGLKKLAQDLAGHDPCFGAPALDRVGQCPHVSYDDLLPTPIDAANDHSDAYKIQPSTGSDCWSYQPRFTVKTCTFGNKKSATNVVLVGNSHAGQWLPALQRLASEDGFRITTRLASRCALADIRQQFDTSAFATACLNWVHKVTDQVIKMHPSLVVMTNRISTPAENTSLADSPAKYAEGYRSILQAWKAAGLHVLVLRDTPAPGTLIPDCVAQKKSSYADCDGTRAKWLQPQPEKDVIAALGDPDIRYADLTDHICEPVVCHAVTGGVITYFDGSHLTATFATTLAPYLGVPLRAMLRLK